MNRPPRRVYLHHLTFGPPWGFICPLCDGHFEDWEWRTDGHAARGFDRHMTEEHDDGTPQEAR